MKKICQVIILSSGKALAPLYLIHKKVLRSALNAAGYNKVLNEEYIENGIIDFQNLYILSDDEIIQGDYFYSPSTNQVYYASKDMLSWNSDTTQEHKGWKKVIATTNPELHYKESNNDNHPSHSIDKDYNVPKISQDFIEAYIKEYDADNIIKEVMVEYDIQGYRTFTDIGRNEIRGSIELNIITKLCPDNIIYISRIKDKTYTRDEVFELTKEAFKEGFLFSNEHTNGEYGGDNFYKENESNFEKWFEDNCLN